MIIGNVELQNNIILAPMAGVTDLPFRLLCKRMGAGLVCMEMVSAKAITYKNKNTESLLEIHPDEGPVSLQLFGREPDTMAEAVCMIQDNHEFDILDVNMGCPVPKIVGNGEGSALMKEPELAGEIVKALVKVSKRPVTVKIRKGFDDSNINAVEMAKIIEDAGASMVAVHGRTREQYYSGSADWNIIRQVKEAVSIPVVGNGDVTSGETAKSLIDTTGCDGIMIGRGVRGNPWLMAEINHYLSTGEELPRPNNEEIADVILEHGRMLIEYKGEYIGIREMRKHTAWYTAGMPNSSKFRGRICEMETYEQLKEAVCGLLTVEK